MDVYPHWQPAIAVIIVHLFNLFTWSINSLSPRVKAVQHGCSYLLQLHLQRLFFNSIIF